MPEQQQVPEGKIFVSAEPALGHLVNEWKSLGHFLLHRLEHDHPETTIYVDFASGRRWKGKELRCKILNIASALVDQYNFKPGTVVCISYDNSDLSMILAIAVIVAGGTVACAYPKDPYLELLYLARKVEPKLLFCHEKNINWAKQIELNLGYKVEAIAISDFLGTSTATNGGGHHHNLATSDMPDSDIKHLKQLFDYDFTQSKCRDNLPAAIRDLHKQVAVITMSSGTTGRPKAVPSTHWNCLADLTSQRSKLTKTNIHMVCCASLDYVSGRILALGAIQSGCTTVLVNGFDPKSYLEAVQQYRASVVYLGAAAFYNLITYRDLESYDISSVRSVFPMGAKIIYLDELREFFKKHPHIVQVRQGFGASELSGGCMNSFTPDDYLKNCDNCGKLLNGLRAKIVHPETGELLGVNQQGILHLSGETVFPGYYDVELKRKMANNNNHPDKQQAIISEDDNDDDEPPLVTNEEIFDKDGFFITGDIAYFNEMEELIYVGRHKELMSCRAAKKVLPQELEEVICEHPAVSKACVLGIPNKIELTLHCPRAYVVPKRECYSDSSMIKTERLKLQFCSNRSPSDNDDSSEHGEEILEHVGSNKLSKMDPARRRQLAEDLMEFVNDRVGWEKHLTGGIVILDEIPTSKANGKMNKNYLRSLSLEQVEIYGDRSG